MSMNNDQELVRQMYALAKKYPMMNHQENMLLLRVAKRLDEQTRARALKWPDAVKRGYYGEPGYVTGYVDEYGMEFDCWALLYSAHSDVKDDLFAIVNKDTMWTLRSDMAEVIIWSAVPTAAQIEEELARRGIQAQKEEA
jgi:hypothetical protein